MSATHPDLLDHYMYEMADSIRRSEATEHSFKDVVARHQDRFGQTVTADFRAATHPELKQAIGDGAFYRDRAKTYGIAALALMEHRKQREVGS